MHIQRLYWDSQSRRTFVHNVGVEPTLKRYNPELPFWQNVKRSPPQCPSSHQNTVWWIRRAFSGDLQNTLCYGFDEKGIHITHWHWIGLHPDTPALLTNAFYYLLICWHGTSSGEWNPVFLRFIFQRFDFRTRNNSVWQVKLYCLTPQTILFGSRNNIVPGTFCLYSENEMYSFLKSKASFRHSVCNHSHFVSRLSDFRKVRVSTKGVFG